MEENIFVLDRDGNLREMKRSGFQTEDIFQELLGRHPALLSKAAGIGGKLLLITREQGVPEEHGGYGRWSLDHLFVDLEGVPVFVEVKRAEDTRARREVVAQMLDYAANGVAFWQVSDLITSFEKTAAESDRNPDELLLEFLDEAEASDGRVEAFWKSVDANLQAGRIRMLFVADRISKELARIVEFLNGQMRSAEMLAIELEHYNDGSEVRTIVPRLIGATERAETAKAVTDPNRKPSQSLEEGLAEMAQVFGQDAKTGAEKAIEWFQTQGFYVSQTRAGAAACVLVPKPDGGNFWPFFIRWNSGRFEFSVSYLKKIPVYASPESRQTLIDTMTRKLGSTDLRLSAKAADGWPSIAVEDLLKPDVWAGFVEVATEIIDRIQGKVVLTEAP